MECAPDASGALSDRTANDFKKKFFRVFGLFRDCCFCPAAKIILGWTTGARGG
jgi:hypothetical protein